MYFRRIDGFIEEGSKMLQTVPLGSYLRRFKENGEITQEEFDAITKYKAKKTKAKKLMELFMKKEAGGPYKLLKLVNKFQMENHEVSSDSEKEQENEKSIRKIDVSGLTDEEFLKQTTKLFKKLPLFSILNRLKENEEITQNEFEEIIKYKPKNTKIKKLVKLFIEKGEGGPYMLYKLLSKFALEQHAVFNLKPPKQVCDFVDSLQTAF